jgi:hypothetical protein
MIVIGIFIVIILCIHSQIEYFSGGYRGENDCTFRRKHNRHIWDNDDYDNNSKTIK